MGKSLDIVIKRRSLASRQDLIRDWDYDLNTVGPDDLDVDSRKSVHWKCHVNPERKWMAIVKNRVAGSPCPGCMGGADRAVPKKRPKAGASVAEKCPWLVDEWCDEYNGDIKPSDVSCGTSHNRYWWRCSVHGVVWEASPHDRVAGKGCPMCRGAKISKARSTIKPGDSLADKYPDLTMEWDILRNTTTPDKVFAHGSDEVHWVCLNCRNRWVAPVYNRTCNGAGCNVCSTNAAAAKRRVPMEGSSLADMYPLIANELVVSEYGDTDPNDIAYSSGTICTWKCSVCNETIWDAPVNSRTAKRKDVPGCVKCSHKRIGRENMKPREGGSYLIDVAPQLEKEWCDKENFDEFGIRFSEISSCSNVDVYWRCPHCNEVYKKNVNKRVNRGEGHGGCSKGSKASFPEKAVLFYVSKVFPDAVGNASPDDVDGLGQKDFDIWIPSRRQAVEYDGGVWHEDDERDRIKDDICLANGIEIFRIRETRCPKYGSNKNVTFIDREPDGGYRTLDSAIRELLACICDGGTVGVDVDTLRDESEIRASMGLEYIRGSLAETHKDVAEQWDYAGNGNLTPWMFKPFSSMVVRWLCPSGHGSYEQKIADRTNHGMICCCETCVHERRTRPKKPKPGRSLQDLHPDIASEWHPKLNGGLTPSDVSQGSSYVAWWVCPNHEEPYQMSVSTKAHGGRCPICSGRIVLRGFNDIATKSDILTNEWDDAANGDITPYNTYFRSDKVVHWICSDPDCRHRWTASVRSRFDGSGCHKCVGKRISIAKMRPEDGKSLYDLYKDISSEWSDENKPLTPKMVRPGSSKRVVWTCKYCGESWTQSIKSRVKDGECGCDDCRDNHEVIKRVFARPPAGESLLDTNEILARYWDNEANGGLTAADVYEKNGNECVWTCPTCSETWVATGDLMSHRKYPCKRCRREHRY